MHKLKVFISWTCFLIGSFFLLLFSPYLSILPTGIAPTTDYSSAVQAINQEKAQEASKIDPQCVSQLLTHGQRTKKVVVLFHGYTSCPQQMAALGEAFFKAGYNVYIPRAPYHGYADHLTPEVGNLTAAEYVKYAEKSIALARGLGEETTVAGISGGGILAAWSAQHLKGVHKSIIMSPGIGIQAVPENVTLPFIRLYEFLPAQWKWWNEEDRGKHGLPYEYPQMALNVLARIMRVGRGVLFNSSFMPPAAQQIVFVYNPNDTSIAPEPVKSLEKNWKAKAGDRVSSYTFPGEWALPHAFVDPNLGNAYTSDVFAKLIELAN